jgi:hypothetical protein
MPSRRSRGDGGLHWDAHRQRWIAAVTVGYTPAGKRIVKRGSGRTKTEAKNKLKEIMRDHEDGLASSPHGYTVAQAVMDWLNYGLSGRDASTIETRRILAEQHVIPALGARKLRDLSAEDVDHWLAAKARTLSTRTLRDIRSILSRSIARAQARDKVKRNVALLCDVPVGREGRPSKALTLAQAEPLLDVAEGSTIGAYIVLSLLTGARTEELRRSPGRMSISTATREQTRRYHRTLWCGARSGPAATRRRGSPAGRSRSRAGASMHFGASGSVRPRPGGWPAVGGMTTTSCSPRKPARSSTRRTSGARSGRSRREPGCRQRTGRRGSCGTASSRCCRTAAFRWSRFLGSLGTAGRRSPSWCTESRSVRWSTTARP